MGIFWGRKILSGGPFPGFFSGIFFVVFLLGFPILKMVRHPGGHWHPGKGPYPNT